MKVLGIDPGSRVMGLGLVQADGDRLRCLHADAVKSGGGELPARLAVIYHAVSDVVERFQPDVVAIEQVFMAHNARSALVLGQARGSAICAAVNGGLPMAEYSARSIKQAVVGSGAAGKEQVQHMVRILLGLDAPPKEDAADALACAICHINTSQSNVRLSTGVVQ